MDYDEKDSTSYFIEAKMHHDKFTNNYRVKDEKKVNQHKIILLKEVLEHSRNFESDVYQQFMQVIKKLQNENFEIITESFGEQLFHALLPVYNILTYGEATSCQACLQGIAFGNRVEGKN